MHSLRILVATLILVTVGCSALDLAGLGLFGISEGGLSAQTVLTSSSLSTSADAAQTRTVVDSPGGLRITPDDVDGKILSVLFAIDQSEDQGVVIFGNERPDIASTDAVLHDFDLGRRLPIDSNIALQPDFEGGPSSLMVLLFGYMDFTFTLGGRTRIVRVALADIEPMQRGDVLLRTPGESSAASETPDIQITPVPDVVGNDDPTAEPVALDGFQWFDLDAGEFTAERPANPALIEQVRDFNDPIRPALVFYPINVFLSEPVQLTADDLEGAESINVVIDFALNQSIVLVNEHFEGLADFELITSFSLSQITTGFSDSGFRAAASVEFVGLTAEPESELVPEPTVQIFSLDRGEEDRDTAPTGTAPPSRP